MSGARSFRWGIVIPESSGKLLNFAGTIENYTASTGACRGTIYVSVEE